MYCPDCGRNYKDREIRFCPYCTIPLTKKHHLFGFKSPRKKSLPASRKSLKSGLTPRSKHPDRIRRFYILVTVFILLILCFFGALLTGYIEVPAFVAPFVEPTLEAMREFFNTFIDLPIPAD